MKRERKRKRRDKGREKKRSGISVAILPPTSCSSEGPKGPRPHAN